MGPTRHLCGIRTDRYMIGDATCLILAGNKSIWLVDLIRRPVAEFAVAPIPIVPCSPISHGHYFSSRIRRVYPDNTMEYIVRNIEHVGHDRAMAALAAILPISTECERICLQVDSGQIPQHCTRLAGRR